MTYPEAARIRIMAKYNGLNKTAIASFQPNTASAPYIQTGTWETDDTILLLASTKAASASRLNRDSSDMSFVGVRSWNAVDGSKGNASAEGSGSAASTGGRVGRRAGSEGSTLANRGSRARVYR